MFKNNKKIIKGGLFSRRTHVTEPRGPTRAPAWRGCYTCAYIHIIYIILRVILHISIPYSKLANPLFSSHLINASLSLNFYCVGQCSPFVFKCKSRGLTRVIGSRAQKMTRVDHVDSWST